jgi:hypothetical protein
VNRRRTPQEKKLLSYEKDRRGDYGDSNMGSRKSIPLRKRMSVRSYRRTTKQQLPQQPALARKDDLTAAEARVLWVRREDWRKWLNMTLAEWVTDRKDRRLFRYRRKKDAQASQ